ncbi:hypothetical protein SAY87_028041 [Trapa incisa]|uniref:Uncharacterized protein n=1 Tax=Trapa incisa TaxID=236973 RepID=A0AAN7KTA2_9MYRT|nr:hypothetical protein SAY87_028041 [Trapa incisa]
MRQGKPEDGNDKTRRNIQRAGARAPPTIPDPEATDEDNGRQPPKSRGHPELGRPNRQNRFQVTDRRCRSTEAFRRFEFRVKGNECLRHHRGEPNRAHFVALEQ